MMRRLFVICALVAGSACSSPSGPSSVGSATDISGAWSGTFASSNNPTMQMDMTVTQNGGTISGTWTSSSVTWSGQITGTMDGSSFNGQLAFSGMAANGTTCTGSANVSGSAGTSSGSGSAGTSSLSLTSATGVTGATCPAPLPVGIQIDLHR
jgi:hypothetical protein